MPEFSPLFQFMSVLCVFLLAFFLFIHPVMALVSCLRNVTLPTKEKGLWFLGILLTWSLGNLAYGLLNKGSRTFRRLTLFPLVLFAITALYLFWYVQSLPEDYRAQWQQRYQVYLTAPNAASTEK